MAVYADGGKYCFRCGYTVKGDIRSDYKEIGDVLNDIISDNNKAEISGKSNKFSSEALAYLYKFSITDQEIAQYGIKFVESGTYYCANQKGWFDIQNHLYFPILGSDGSEVGFQTKCIDPTQKIKTLTSKYSGTYNCIKLYGNKLHPYDYVIVEGILDAISLNRTGRPCIALLGNTLSKSKMLSILPLHLSYPVKISVWMDNDAGGEMHREEIATFFEALTGSSVRHIRTEKDPKHYSPTQIEEILK